MRPMLPWAPYQTKNNSENTMKKRSAPVTRKTTETDIALTLTIDGSGQYEISTPVPFLTHMLELFSRHGMFDLELKAAGDVDIDYHHTVEDIGICLGQALRDAMGDKQDMTRYGEATIPMDEAAANTCIDLGGRPFLSFDVPDMPQKVGDFDLELVAEFFQAFVNNSACNLHIRVLSGKNAHHIIEAIFKSFARALDNATRIDPRGGGVRSTKGTL
jgi:imidazoleglycerol-phosphate dehydratase